MSGISLLSLLMMYLVVTTHTHTHKRSEHTHTSTDKTHPPIKSHPIDLLLAYMYADLCPYISVHAQSVCISAVLNLYTH